MAFEDIHELAADMHHAGLLAGQPIAEQPVEAGEPVGMDSALVVSKMRGGMLSLSIHAELIVSHEAAIGPRPMANAHGGAGPHHGRSSRT
jgi:hypothetical protein